MASIGTGATAVAFVLVDFNDPSFHEVPPKNCLILLNCIKLDKSVEYSTKDIQMKDYLPIIRSSRLFSGVSEEELNAMLGCLDMREGHFEKGDYILRAGDSTNAIRLVLSGSVLVVQEDIWGNRHLLSKVGPGHTFAETFACAPGAVLNVNAVAEGSTVVMNLNVQRILTVCSSACSHHARIVRNLLGVLAEKNLHLNEKLTHMGQRTTRAKLMSYLSAEAQRFGSYEFDVPFTRQQLADYLAVDRSGLSLELSKMKAEGLLDYRRSHFILNV